MKTEEELSGQLTFSFEQEKIRIKDPDEKNTKNSDKTGVFPSGAINPPEYDIQLESRPQLLIIDGSSMLTTNYYATLPKSILYAKTQEEQESHYHEIMHAKDGTYTNAVYATLRMMSALWSQNIAQRKPPSLDVRRNWAFS